MTATSIRRTHNACATGGRLRKTIKSCDNSAHFLILLDFRSRRNTRRELRQTESRPLLARLEAWLKEQYLQILPKSPLGQAIAYTLSNRAALNCYTDEGYLAIDNNAAERALRRVALGRKNWLFAGSDNGAEWAATIYSLIDTCQRQHVEPWAYFQDVLSRPPHPRTLPRSLASPAHSVHDKS